MHSMLKNKLFRTVVILSVAVTMTACAASKSEKGAMIGGAAGAVIGGVIGKQAGNTAAGVILGAVVGGATGAIIGDYMDKQAEELDQALEGATVERVGEGIKITFASGLLFDVDDASLRPASQQNLDDLAEVLNKYNDTNILVEGHTDNTGAEDYNDRLSVRRAESVANYLAYQDVIPGRVSAVGYGERQPVADNSTAEGRQANRRVEVAIWANDELKKAAEKKAQG